MQLSFKEIASVSLILFSVIDMIGNVPVIVDLRKKAGKVQSGLATIVAGALMVIFLLFPLFSLSRRTRDSRGREREREEHDPLSFLR